MSQWRYIVTTSNTPLAGPQALQIHLGCRPTYPLGCESMRFQKRPLKALPEAISVS